LCNVIATATKPDYASIEVPLLILAGEEDKSAPLSGSEAILEAYGTEKSQKKLKILEGIGHWHCVEAPEEVSREILAFATNLE
jgi:pimeloyl-ACP methyl ester carboxylesterase